MLYRSCTNIVHLKELKVHHMMNWARRRNWKEWMLVELHTNWKVLMELGLRMS